MRKFWITFCFYAKDHFKTKSLIVLGIFTAATVGIIFAVDHFGGGNDAEVAIVQSSDVFVVPTDLFDHVEGAEVRFMEEAEARALFDAEELDDLFIVAGTERPELRIESTHLNSHSEVQFILEHWLNMVHIERMMLAYDLPAEMVGELMMPIAVDLELADFEDLIAVELINSVVPIMIMMLVVMSGQMVANSVASEKTSRVMEVMLGKVHPTVTMLSKILSSLLGLLLPIVAIVAGVAISQIAGLIELDAFFDFINAFISTEALILTVIVLILGYFCFIFLFAAAGAIANSIESLTSTLTPVTYLVMVPYFAAIFFAIGGPIVDILVYIPFVTPYVLVQRFILGYAGMLEIGISLAGMVLFSVLMLMISARLYMNGISHTSEKVTLKDFRKMLQK